MTPKRRNGQVAGSFNVEAHCKAILAIAGFGSFGAPFGLDPALGAAGAFERPGTAAAAGSQKLPLARKPLESQ
jgi:hypothetical protein